MAAEQDRRSNMVNSSVNAPMKKGGAGGSYTWGAATDVQDFMPVGVAPGTVGVVSAPQVVSPTAGYVMQAAPAFQMDQSAFPVLGNPGVQYMATQWGPTPVNTGQITSGALRSTFEGGQGQPRNMFAKKPYTTVRAANTEVVAQAQQGTIDWNQTGMPVAVMQSIVQSGAAAAHLGPYAQAAPVQIPLSTLQAQTAFGSQQIYQGMSPTNVQNFAPRPMQVPASRR